MKKKIILCLLVIVGLFTLVGCGSEKKESQNNKEEKEKEVVDETLFKINNLEFHLDKEASFKNIKYTISKDFKEIVHDYGSPYIQYNYYQEDSTNLLYFRIFYYENKDVKYAFNDLGLEENVELVDGKTDNIEYKYYKAPRDDGGTINYYVVNDNSDIYIISFISKYDIKDFEEKTIKSIKF